MLLNTAPIAPMFVAQTRTEFLRLIRIPAFTITSLALPIMFYALFGLPHAHEELMDTSVGLYSLASFSAYSVLTIVLFSFGASVAAERGTGATRKSRRDTAVALANRQRDWVNHRAGLAACSSTLAAPRAPQHHRRAAGYGSFGLRVGRGDRNFGNRAFWGTVAASLSRASGTGMA